MFQVNSFVTLLFLFFFLSAFADDDCFFCSIEGALVQGSEWLWDGAVGATEDAKDLLLPPSQPPPPGQSPQPNLFLPPDTPETPETATITDDQSSQNVDDVIHLTVFATPDPKPPVLTDVKCNPGDPVDVLDVNSCGIATKKIIWPSNCGDIVANENILNALITITKSADRVGTSSNRCGTFFWTASLTEVQMEELNRDTPGIYTVVPDTTGRWNSFSGAQRRIQRRDTVLIETNASPDLSYISTPPLIQNPDNIYAQFADAGRGVRVYIIDDGAVPTLREFTANNVIKGYMYALGSSPYKAELTNHGNCVASKVGGFRDGVVKKADLIIVQIEVEISSLLDGLERVLVECQTRVEAGQNIQGYTVVQIAIGHTGEPSGTNEIKLMGLIQELVEQYQVIVVLASTDLGSEVLEVGEVDVWNEILHREPVIPVIVVGAVDMRNGNPPTYTTTIANDLTVSAPDDGYCADARWWNILGRQLMRGNSIASGVVSGLVADFLSRNYIRQYLGLDLRENQNRIAQLIRDYVVQKAFFRREGTSLTVWNGLYCNDPYRIEP